MKRIVIQVGTALVLGLGCGSNGDMKDQDNVGAPAPATGSGSTVASGAAPGTRTGPPGSGAGSAAPAAANVCDQPCLLLKDRELAGARTACPEWAVAKDPAACDELDFTRNCIYASAAA